MADEKLEALLTAWGREYGEPYREEPRRWRQTANHPIAQSMEFAPGKRVTRATRQLVGRGGYQRRRILGAAAGLFTKDGEPMAVSLALVDPIRCKESRSRAGLADRRVRLTLQKVERAVKLLEEISLIRALCIRVQYAGDGEHKDKFAKVNEHLRKVSKRHEGIGLSRYRDELTWGRVWLSGALLEVLQAA